MMRSRWLALRRRLLGRQACLFALLLRGGVLRLRLRHGGRQLLDLDLLGERPLLLRTARVLGGVVAQDLLRLRRRRCGSSGAGSSKNASAALLSEMSPSMTYWM